MAQKLANSVNDRTYQEVEYLKKSLGPILVAALAEICIRRPADPIEYLGHWLLRWRYNEELKRRDVQNAMEVVKARQWTQVKDDTEAWSSANKNFEPIPQQVSTDIPPAFDGSKMLPVPAPAEELDTQTLYAPPEEAPDATPSPGATISKRGSVASKKASGADALETADAETTRKSSVGFPNENRKASGGTTGTETEIVTQEKSGKKSRTSSKSKVESTPASRKSSRKLSNPASRKVSVATTEGAEVAASTATVNPLPVVPEDEE